MDPGSIFAVQFLEQLGVEIQRVGVDQDIGRVLQHSLFGELNDLSNAQNIQRTVLPDVHILFVIDEDVGQV